ncbi:uncharacterized protein DNG_09408 [Cephalotrichum gorgonifer]|uniref:Uncharacterized protein n=1 Tax=Cephalotrichum gorgonifer TaxID=2041049 RepID=A0AAE8N6V3_9PEZI|nr:uncharacterized protein DNG_09408 [Cephalotrichum gorgonifer]
MPPPPSTPAHKFIFKRPHHGRETPLRLSSPRFVTPGAPAHPVSTPTPSQLFLPSSARPRPRYSDEIEDSPPSSPIPELLGVLERDDEVGVGVGDGHGDGDGRERKRRRVSSPPDEIDEGGAGHAVSTSSPSRGIAPSRYRDEIEDSPPSSPVAALEVPEGDIGNGPGDSDENGAGETSDAEKERQMSRSPTARVQEKEGPGGILENFSSSSSSSSSDAIAGTDGDSFSEAAASEGSPGTHRDGRPLARQPKFQEPPRFKLPSPECEPHLEGLPPAFTPQRRGAKYVPGGLAAEVQGWLSHIKGSKEMESMLRVSVQEVREGGRMYLVRGRRLGGPSGIGGGGGGGEEEGELRILLAGEGEMTGLGNRASVTEGCVIEAGGPRWDVELDGLGKWTVVCDWRVAGSSPYRHYAAVVHVLCPAPILARTPHHLSPRPSLRGHHGHHGIHLAPDCGPGQAQSHPGRAYGIAAEGCPSETRFSRPVASALVRRRSDSGSETDRGSGSCYSSCPCRAPDLGWLLDLLLLRLLAGPRPPTGEWLRERERPPAGDRSDLGERDPRRGGEAEREELELVEMVETESSETDRARPRPDFLISSSSRSSSSLFFARSASRFASSASAKPFLK